MKLSVIIVNYKSAKYIVECLKSAKKFKSFETYEWIIIDNDSKDDSKEIITREFPNIIWHSMNYNAGFARANNQGIKLSKCETILLLNPDTIILNDAIEVCFQKLYATKYIACGIQMLNRDLTTQISGSHFMKGGLNHLLPLPYWGSFLKNISRFFNLKKPSIEKATEIEEIDWISGAFLMVKKSAINKAGLMDDDFFLYGEEVEWCSRLGKIGPLCIFGEINIIHLIGEIISSNSKSADKSYENLFDKKGLQLILSNHVRIRKQYGILWFFVQILNYTLAIPVFLLFSVLENTVKLKNPFIDLSKVFGLAKNVMILWYYSLKIIRNEPYFYKVL